MAAIEIPCPECGSVLRLKDPALLGRVGKCPKCTHRFPLEDPGVDLELVEAQGSAEAFPPLEFAEADPALVITQSSEPAPVAPSPVSTPTRSRKKGKRRREASPESQQQRAKRRQKDLRMQIIVGAVSAVALTGVVFGAKHFLESQPEEKKVTKKEPPKQNEDFIADKSTLKANLEELKKLSPTKGDPVDLRFLLPGTRIVFHFRPADIWKAEKEDTEELKNFRFTLGDLGKFLEKTIRDYTFHEPHEVEEMVIGIGLLQRDSPPEISGRVTLVNEIKSPSSYFLKKNMGSNEEYGYKIYTGPKSIYAWKPQDKRTFGFAVLPEGVGQFATYEDFAKSALKQTSATDGIETLIEKTDRKRHFNLMFEPGDFLTFDNVLVGEKLRPWLLQLANWFGDETETVLMSMHLGKDQERLPMHTEMVVRLKNTVMAQVTSMKLQRVMNERIDQLPLDLRDLVLRINPKTKGLRELLGRFPAMVEAINLNVMTAIDDRNVYLVSRLPTQAAPNLALSTYVTLQQAVNLGSGEKTGPVNTGPKLPELVLDRLKKSIELEFNSQPLDEVLKYIGDETKVNFVLHGKGFERVGITQVQRQTFNLGSKPALEGLKKIHERYPKLAFVIDQANKSVIVTSDPVAMEDGQKPYEFK